ncbi:hypothetical protein TNCV_4510001 [Trichonephila clavipes]|nr:hypothetical protein TNCV_4510001 [Trichonephila clavipes]
MSSDEGTKRNQDSGTLRPPTSQTDINQTTSISNEYEKGENTGGMGLPPLFPFHQPHERIRLPPCRKGTIHLQTSMSSPGFEPSPYGTAVSVANH